MPKYVYFFAPAQAEGNKDMKDLLGRQRRQPGRDGRDRPARPPGFTVSTEACNIFSQVRGDTPRRG